MYNLTQLFVMEKVVFEFFDRIDLLYRAHHCLQEVLHLGFSVPLRNL